MVLAERIRKAINEHDIEAFVACVDSEYQSEQPAHPARAFRGADQVRTNWSGLFQEIPDIQAELLGTARDGDTEWAEWRWHGTRTNGSHFEMRGVTVMHTRADRALRARLYMEEVDSSGEDIDHTVRRLSGAEG